MDKCVLVRKEEVAETLASIPKQGKKSLEPLKSLALANKLPFNILEDHQILENDAEAHTHECDLWICLEGEPTFIYGGEMVNPWYGKLPDGSENQREIKAKEIRNGTKVVLKPGDWLWIPAGQPHQHNCAGTTRLAIIKIPSII